MMFIIIIITAIINITQDVCLSILNDDGDYAGDGDAGVASDDDGGDDDDDDGDCDDGNDDDDDGLV